MSKLYHVLNDYSLEQLTEKESALFSERAPRLAARTGKANGLPATFYRNFHGELVYLRVESDNNLDGYVLNIG